MKKYRRSRAGCRLFHCIYTWVNQVGHQATNLSTDQNRHKLTRTACNAINWSNLKTIDLLRSYNYPSLIQYPLVNCRSSVNKTSENKLEIVQSHLDLFALTETWIRDNDTLTETQICPPGYKAVSIPHPGRTGGGIALIYCDSLQVKRDTIYSFQTMECTNLNLSLQDKPLHLAIIYRPLGSNINTFASELMDFIEPNINNKDIPIIIGDLNIHMNNSEGADTNNFLDILDSLDFTNWIQFPTHKSQNTIDLVILPRQSSIITSVSQGYLFSDHYLVNFQIQYTTTKPVTKLIKFSKLKSINPQAFSRDVKTLLDDHNPVDLSPCECLKLYRNKLTTVPNTHTPEKTRKAATRSRIPWFNDSIGMAIRHRCMAECNWANHCSDPMAFTTFYRARHIVSNLMDAAENRLYKDSLTQHQGKSKGIFKICDSLLGRNQVPSSTPMLYR